MVPWLANDFGLKLKPCVAIVFKVSLIVSTL